MRNLCRYTAGDGSPDRPVISLATLMNGAALVTATACGTIQVWSTESFETVHKMKVSGDVHHMDALPGEGNARFYLHGVAVQVKCS
jgi:hypothetical protein